MDQDALPKVLSNRLLDDTDASIEDKRNQELDSVGGIHCLKKGVCRPAQVDNCNSQLVCKGKLVRLVGTFSAQEVEYQTLLNDGVLGECFLINKLQQLGMQGPEVKGAHDAWVVNNLPWD